MKDFCCMAVPPDQDDRQEGTGHCCEDNSRSTPPEKVADVHKELMKYLQDEEFRDNIRGRKAVWVVPEVLLVLIITTCVAISFLTSYRRPFKLKSYYLGLQTWNWIVLAMEFLCGLSIIRSVTYVVLLLIIKHQRHRPGKYVLFFATGLKTSIDVAVWLDLVFFTWLFWLRPRIKLTSDDAREAVHYITPSLLCLSLGSLSWLLKDMLRLRLEAKFRFCQVFDRIRHTILDLHAIRILDCKTKETETKETKWKFLKKTKKKLLIEVYKMDKEVPVWILEKLANLYMKDVEKETLEGNDQDDEKLVDLAEKKFHSIVENSNGNHNHDYICLTDWKNTYLEYLKNTCLKEEDEEEECEKVLDDYLFRVLAKSVQKRVLAKKERKGKESKPKRIKRDQFLRWAVAAYKNCWALQQSLRLSEKAFIQLNKLLSIFVIVLMIAIWVLRTNTFNTSELALLFAPVFASAFNSCKNMVDGLIFIFGMHPFDVGDRVDIDKMQMMVRRMNMLTTVFLKYDTQVDVIYPNSVLAGKTISNFGSATDQPDNLDFSLNKKTPPEDIEDIDNRLLKYLKEEPHYSAEAKVVKKESQSQGWEMTRTVYFRHLASYLDEKRAVRKSNISTFIDTLLKKNRETRYNDHPSNPDDIVEFNIPAATSLKKIEELEETIMRYLKDNPKYKIYVEEEGHTHKKYSKLLIKELGEKEIKMALHLKNPHRETPAQKPEHKMDIEIKIKEEFIRDLQQQEERSSGNS
ncbi:hypothetical protein Ancab_029728 [Ancistrocladus abbreviatus]